MAARSFGSMAAMSRSKRETVSPMEAWSVAAISSSSIVMFGSK